MEQSLESDDNCLVEYVGDVLVVKAQGATNIENTFAEIREERIQELSGWVLGLFDTSILVAALVVDHPKHTVCPGCKG